MSLENLSKIDLFAAALGLYVLYRYLSTSSKSPLPPGPRGLPIIGNVADMPSKKDWLTFAEWGRKYGGICSVKLFGQPMIIINSAEIMSEFEGAKYSDRPVLEMGGELLGYKDTLVLLRYGSRFRTFRKYFANHYGPLPMEKHLLTIENETHRFLKRQLAHPDTLEPNLRKLAGGVIMKLTYGYTVEEGEDPYVNLIEGANSNFNAATVPGAFLVDSFPSLRQLPEWLPGMGFMETARRWLKDTMDMVDVPFAFTKKEIAAGTAPPSFVADVLQDEHLKLTEEQERDVAFTASSMYGGGADTTVSAEYAFFLAMVLFPDVLKKAQEEIDTVIGNDRLPTISDRSQLPYVSALVLEVLRWNSVIPTGIPHTASEDSVVNGYFIPKGSLIVTNLWAMLHDPETYPDPFVFRPERHIATPGKPVEKDPRTICFGYGRRICPGMHLAEASIFSCISRSLAVFDIKKAVENGVEITPVHENTTGTMSYPEAYKCSVKPRSEKAVALIAQEYHF
ncbi:putative cytochrome P450 family protein [Lyophyllum shimeji]|uniref:Cytochrome P450 family protein n=1 Tax=Lyophyllum shimeji TaxID=47721 RepID=A0A9P3PSR2_LYOSH|nr:putative cytochrome P450 family protein [Lyophyllum shimeji]